MTNQNPDARAALQNTAKRIALTIFKLAGLDPSGLMKAGIIYAITIVICFVGWIPLSWPARYVSTFITAGDCGQYEAGTIIMYFCSAKVAALTMAGPFIITIIVILLRKPLIKVIGKFAEKLPQETHFLTAPLLATLLFTLTWSAVHYQSDDGTGFFSQQYFPVVIGLFTFITSHYSRFLQRLLRTFFDRRDHIRLSFRFGLALLLPLFVSLIITFQARVTATALKEQAVLMLSLFTGYLVLAPREGDLLTGMRTMMNQKPE